MTVGELISKMSVHFVELAINEYKGQEHTSRRYIIEKDSTDYTHIPKDVWNAEVANIIPYYGRISIEIEKKGK